MKIKRYLIRYHPPGIILEYNRTSAGASLRKTIDLLHLHAQSNPRHVTHDILKTHEAWIGADRYQALFKVVTELITRLRSDPVFKYDLNRDSSSTSTVKPQFHQKHRINAHLLSMTQLQLNKSGDRLVTASYDRTCKIWDTNTGRELAKLVGHEHAISSVSFNHPYGNRVLTGSFDSTCAIWDSNTGSQLATLQGHTAEVTTVTYSGAGQLSDQQLVVSGSRDATARVWDPTTGTALLQPFQHEDEVVCVEASSDGRVVLTGSFDTTCRLWDLRSSKNGPVLVLGNTGLSHASKQGLGNSNNSHHSGGITRAILNWDASQAISASIDGYAKVWDISTGRCIISVNCSGDKSNSSSSNHAPRENAYSPGDEVTASSSAVTDIALDPSGHRLATASESGHIKLVDTRTGTTYGHVGAAHGGQPVASVRFNSFGSLLVSAGEDGTARVWHVGRSVSPHEQTDDTKDMHNLSGLTHWQTLPEHNAGVFSACFSYSSDLILTGSTDNTCHIWKMPQGTK